MNTQLFYCKQCWKQFNNKNSKNNQTNKVHGNNDTIKTYNRSQPKITNYYSIPLCLKQRLNKNSNINISNDYKLINPNIEQLFKTYNYLFFDNKLYSVQLKWNHKEKYRAGYCKYNNETNECLIELSLCLLQYRSSKEMIETLIHEMIHSYLFIKKLNNDHTSHGSRFLSIMNVINHVCKDCNLNITVRHNFHDEIQENKSCKWECNLCQRIIYRPYCRPPGKHEKWWNKHKRECGGVYKIIESNNIKINWKSGNNHKRKEKANKMTDENTKILKQFVNCPICNIYVHQFLINEHLDQCGQ